MKEDLAIARNSLLALQAENAALRRASQHGQPLEDKANVLDRFDPEMAEALAEERKKRQDIEKELDLQVWVALFFVLSAFLKITAISGISQGGNGNGYEAAGKGYPRKARHNRFSPATTRRYQIHKSGYVPEASGNTNFPQPFLCGVFFKLFS